MSRVLTVFGATGNQGGAVIKAILGHSQLSKHFKLRGITRNTSSPKAQALSSQGVELVSADLSNPSSLKAAVEGSDSVFAVTNYWESMSKSVELSQGKAIADACVAANVKHVVWSALPNVTNLSGGKLKKVEHFDGKHEIAQYFESVKGSMITTFFMPGFYMSNLKGMTRSIPQVNDGIPTLTLSWDAEKTHVPLLDAADDSGVFVAGILAYENPKELDGQYIQAVSEWLTPKEIVSQLGEVIGREVKFNGVSQEVLQQIMSGTGNPAAEELVENMVLIRDYSYYGVGAEKKQGESNKVLKAGLKTTTFKEWAEKVGPWEF